MAKIHTLKIENFRSLERFEQIFNTNDFICVIGRGDSGKSTILDAISLVLSPNWNVQFFDTDFFQLDVNKTLVIEATISDLPKTLLKENKFGLHIRGLNKSANEINDQLKEDHDPCLTIRLSVGRDLEPKWSVVNHRQVDTVEIRANDRALLNTFLVSDYVDRHFSWSKGNPLYSLLKTDDAASEKSNVVLDAFRGARSSIDPKAFDHLKGVIKKVELAAKKVGLLLDDITSNIDHKDISVKDGKISLHHNDIPLRANGKGSKRLLSIAIQIELLAMGGILLIDEIEQGLEPDRVRHLVNILKQQNHGQVFITTHSRDVVVELDCSSLFLMRKKGTRMTTFSEVFQGCIRKSPEAFFSKRVIVCEGATEVGICRAINFTQGQQTNKSFSSLGVAMVDGGGSNFIEYCRNFSDAGFEVAALCDSDDSAINAQKKSLMSKGITIFDWNDGIGLENQIFLDLPWSAVQKLIDYAHELKGEQSIADLLRNKLPGNELASNWYESENQEVRIALGDAASGKKIKEGKVIEDKGWFKRIDHGEYLGEVILECLSSLQEKKLGQRFNEAIKWISK